MATQEVFGLARAAECDNVKMPKRLLLGQLTVFSAPGPPGGDDPPQDRIAAEKCLAQALAIAAEQLLAQERPADRPIEGAPQHRDEGVVEPDEYSRPRPDQIAHNAVVAVADPALGRGRGRHGRPELVARRLDPVPPPVQRVELDMRGLQPRRERGGKSGLARAARADHGDPTKIHSGAPGERRFLIRRYPISELARRRSRFIALAQSKRGETKIPISGQPLPSTEDDARDDACSRQTERDEQRREEAKAPGGTRIIRDSRIQCHCSDSLQFDHGTY
jgi:hypothetical protein